MRKSSAISLITTAVATFFILSLTTMATSWGYRLPVTALREFHRVMRMSTAVQSSPAAVPFAQWSEAAKQHRHTLTELLYPPGETMKHRQHMVNEHPIYNFLHRYYRYSVEELYTYSPGYDVPMESPPANVKLSHILIDRNRTTMSQKAKKSQLQQQQHDALLSDRFLIHGEHNMYFSKEVFQRSLRPDGRYGWIHVQQSQCILQKTQKRTAFVGCFGMHEWAMLYSGRRSVSECGQHQGLGLRVSQEVIDSTVEASGIRCTHFDAWRFFHPDAQPMNIFNPMTRKNQEDYEQPGCVHANMDLFKYAYQLYPLVSSDLLVRCLQIALKARTIDIRASPYDATMYSGCEEVLAVETAEGKRRYVQEQESLAREAAPVRAELLAVYSDLLEVGKLGEASMSIV